MFVIWSILLRIAMLNLMRAIEGVGFIKGKNSTETGAF